MSKRIAAYLLIVLFFWPILAGAGYVPPETRELTVSFVGDTCIATQFGADHGETFNALAKRNDPSYFLEYVKEIFQADDFTVANLENVLSDRDLNARAKPGDPSSNFWFTAPAVNAKILSFAGVDGISTANNHSMDYGAEGLDDTIEAVTAEGLEYGSDKKTLYFEKYGFKIAVICQWIWEGSDTLKTAQRRLEAASSDSDFQIMFFHSGTEGTDEVDGWRITAFRKYVDLGADMVINSGPHVIQPIEYYKDTPIVYSLGNFCFGGNRYSSKLTFIFQMKFKLNGGMLLSKESNIIPCYVYTGASSDFRPVPIDNESDINRVNEIVNRNPKNGS